MSCPKCDPGARSRRWVWWAALAALISAGAWLERGHDAPPSPSPASPAPAR